MAAFPNPRMPPDRFAPARPRNRFRWSFSPRRHECARPPGILRANECGARGSVEGDSHSPGAVAGLEPRPPDAADERDPISFSAHIRVYRSENSPATTPAGISGPALAPAGDADRVQHRRLPDGPTVVGLFETMGNRSAIRFVAMMQAGFAQPAMPRGEWEPPSRPSETAGNEPRTAKPTPIVTRRTNPRQTASLRLWNIPLISDNRLNFSPFFPKISALGTAHRRTLR